MLYRPSKRSLISRVCSQYFVLLNILFMTCLWSGQTRLIKYGYLVIRETQLVTSGKTNRPRALCLVPGQWTGGEDDCGDVLCLAGCLFDVY